MQPQTPAQPKRQAYGSDAILFFILLAVAVLLPVIIVPIAGVSLSLAKTLLLSLGGIAALVLWLVLRLQKTSVVIPRTWLIPALLLVVCANFISAIFSHTPHMSLFGEPTQIDSVSTLAMLVLLALLVAFTFQNRARLHLLLGGLLAASGLLGIFHILRLSIGSDVFFSSLFPTVTGTPLGAWNDIGILFGLTLLVSVIMMSMGNLRRGMRVALSLLSLFSLFLAIVISTPAVWVTLLIFSTIFLVYLLSVHFTRQENIETGARKRSIILVGALILISSVMLISGNRLGNSITSTLGVEYVNVWPSWESTIDIARVALKDSFLFGVGPGEFSNMWLLHKPLGVNQTFFWASEFSQGVGRIPTASITTGIFGILAWMLFLFFLLREGFRSLFSERVQEDARLSVLIGLFSTLYLWLFATISTPGMVLYALTFIVTGALLGLFVREGTIETFELKLGTQSSWDFSIILVSVLLIIGALVWGYLIGERALARIGYERTLISLNRDGDLIEAERGIERTLALHSLDRYYRTLAEVRAAQLGPILSDETLSDDVQRSQFQDTLARSIQAGERAINRNPYNYRNYLTLAGVYEALVPAGIDGAYERTRGLYEEAQVYNPTNPALYLALARLEAAQGDLEQARQEIANALTLKPNYTDAIFVLSQIEVADGNIDGAIRAVEAATLISPNDATIYFQLGLLRYNDRDFEGAIGAFENAVRLNPVYANARYFLGLSYEEEGRRTDAISQFEAIRETNADNQEIVFILNNLRAGRSPFEGAVPPLDEAPEDREELPIEE